jgi:hypothetical protein
MLNTVKEIKLVHNVSVYLSNLALVPQHVSARYLYHQQGYYYKFLTVLKFYNFYLMHILCNL